MEHILVTGGAGFIGSHTVDALLAEGHKVRVLDNLSTGKRDNLNLEHANLELVVGDICHAQDVQQAMLGIDRCMHLAAQVSVDLSVKDSAFSCQQNILGFVNVLEAAVKQKLKRVVYASSAAIYGDASTLPIDEAVSTPKPLSPYGLEKYVNEQYATLFDQLHALSSFGVRYFNVYGPRQDPSSHYAGVISIFVSRLQQSKAIVIHGDGQQTRDFIYVGDVARTNIAALFGQQSGVSNVATGKSITLIALVEILSQFAESCSLSYGPPREGDIRLSAASVTQMHAKLAIQAKVQPQEGLRQLWDSTLSA